MRLNEFISEEEWLQLQKLVFDSTWRALTTYQQQRASQQRIASKPAATLKPQAAKKLKHLHVRPSVHPTLPHPKRYPSPSKHPKLERKHTQRIALSKLQPHCHPLHVWLLIVSNLVQHKPHPSQLHQPQL